MKITAYNKNEIVFEQDYSEFLHTPATGKIGITIPTECTITRLSVEHNIPAPRGGDWDELKPGDTIELLPEFVKLTIDFYRNIEAKILMGE